MYLTSRNVYDIVNYQIFVRCDYMSKMSFYFEKYKQAREELMTKIGRHVLNQTELNL